MWAPCMPGPSKAQQHRVTGQWGLGNTAHGTLSAGSCSIAYGGGRLLALPSPAVAPPRQEGGASATVSELRTQAEEFLLGLEGDAEEEARREGQATDQMREQLLALQAKVG